MAFYGVLKSSWVCSMRCASFTVLRGIPARHYEDVQTSYLRTYELDLQGIVECFQQDLVISALERISSSIISHRTRRVHLDLHLLTFLPQYSNSASYKQAVMFSHHHHHHHHYQYHISSQALWIPPFNHHYASAATHTISNRPEIPHRYHHRPKTLPKPSREP